MKRLVWVGAIALAAILAFGLRPGGWVHSLAAAAGIPGNDAYSALDAAETHLPANPRDRERLLLVNALVDGPAPEGMAIERRLRGAGTLARIRYEVIGGDGGATRLVELRALIPALPGFGAEASGSKYGRIECPSECLAQLASSDAILLPRSGQAGIADEWFLRMPLGRPFALGRRSLTIQDVAAKSSRAIPYSQLRVTLVEACQARVRVGAVTDLELDPYATMPWPKGWRTRRWVQLEGCSAMMRAAPIDPVGDAAVEAAAAQARQPPRRLNSDAYKPDPELEAVRPVRDRAMGYASLVVDERWHSQHGQASRFRMLRACRYDRESNRWQSLPFPPDDLEIALRDDASAQATRPPSRVAFRFPDEPGLFWAEWSESDREARASPRLHRALVFAGSNLDCDGADLRAPQGDEITTCVPLAQGAQARVVPAPQSHCPP